MGQFLRRQDNGAQQDIGTQQEIALCAQSIVAGIISNVQGSDDHWIALAADQLGKSEDDIRRYHGHSNDNVLLANLIYITRQIFHSALGDDLSRGMADASSYILPTLSNFDIRNTLPELREEFRALWDEIVENVQSVPYNQVLTDICGNLLNLYNALRMMPWHQQPRPTLIPLAMAQARLPLSTRRSTRARTSLLSHPPPGLSHTITPLYAR
jgi:hypothetical protein